MVSETKTQAKEEGKKRELVKLFFTASTESP